MELATAMRMKNLHMECIINEISIGQMSRNEQYLLLVDVCDFHIHGVYGGKNIGGALHHTLARLRHGDGRAGG